MNTKTRKYELINADTKAVGAHTLYRVRALIDFADVKAGDLGGYVASERNLSHGGNCWIRDQAMAFGDSTVEENAMLAERAIMFGRSKAYGNTQIRGNARLCDDARAFGDSIISGQTQAYGNTRIYSQAVVNESVKAFGFSRIHGQAYVGGNAQVGGATEICDKDIYLGTEGPDIAPDMQLQMMAGAKAELARLNSVRNQANEYFMEEELKEDLCASVTVTEEATFSLR